MSALAWLFGLGALAVAFPFLFHLIRQTPRGRTEFSSLMFLKPTPPRLTQRSRLQNVLLLLLRSAAIVLIALAFMRPFLRTEANQNAIETTGRDILILLDTSASMQTEDVWKSALEEVNKSLDSLETGDQIALATFDNQLKFVVDFPTNLEQTNAQVAAIRKELPQILPGFGKSELGKALSLTADRLESRLEENETSSKLQLILISDQQRTATLDTLQSFQWPAGVKLMPISVASENMSNAAVTAVSFTETDADTVQVRVANSNDSKLEKFALRFESKVEPDGGWRELPVYLPAGTTQSFEFARPTDINIDRVQLIGDDVDFDNTYFFASPETTEYSVLYLGDDDRQDANGIAFFLETCLLQTATRKIDFAVKPKAEPGFENFNLIVISRPPNEAETKLLESHFQSGRTALFLLTNEAIVNSVAQWTGANVTEPAKSRKPSDYSLLVDIDFSHPLFNSFDAPGINDFTNVKFWEHLNVDLTDELKPKVLARFDNLSPAIWQTTIGAGKAISMATSWKPQASMLSVSPKFPIMMNQLLDWAAAKVEPAKSFHVHEPIPIQASDEFEPVVVKPDTTSLLLDNDQASFDETDIPGIYQFIAGQSSSTFAVNVDRAESTAEQLTVEQLESMGVEIGRHDSASEEKQTLRRQDNIKIEQRQKMWKWLIIGAICFLFAETFIASLTKTSLNSAGQHDRNLASGLTGEGSS